jgi:hypothetical protein
MHTNNNFLEKANAPLQQVSNRAARIVSRTTGNMTMVLKKLHWFPVKQRIEFKILVLFCFRMVLHTSISNASSVVNHFIGRHHLGVCSVPLLKVYLSWKSRSSVGVPQLEVTVLLRGVDSPETFVIEI